MAEETDEKEMNRPNAKEMAAKAVDDLGEALTQYMDYLTADQQRDGLLKLVCSMACMCTAGRRKERPEEQYEPFMVHTRRFLLGVAREVLPAPRGEDYKVTLGAGVEAALAADPDKASMLQSVIADIRQALDGVASGKFASPEEALASLGGTFVSMDDLPEEVQAHILGEDGDKGTLQ